MDNSEYQRLAKSFPRGFKVNLNPVIQAQRHGIQMAAGGLVASVLGFFVVSHYYTNYPLACSCQKTRTEYQAQPDYFSKSVRYFSRSVHNKFDNL